MKNVTYWYQFFTRCKELVPIFHSVKFAKCENCGSTGLQCHLSRLKDIVCKLKGIQDILINSRDMGIQCFLDLGIFAIFHLGMWDIFQNT